MCHSGFDLESNSGVLLFEDIVSTLVITTPEANPVLQAFVLRSFCGLSTRDG